MTWLQLIWFKRSFFATVVQLAGQIVPEITHSLTWPIWPSPLPRFVFFLTTYGVSPNAYNNKFAQSNLGRGPRHGTHTYAVKSPLVTMVCPKFAPKVLLPMDLSSNPTTCLIPGPIRPMMPFSIWIRSAVFPQCTGQTDWPTDRSSTGKFDDHRPLRYESDAA